MTRLTRLAMVTSIERKPTAPCCAEPEVGDRQREHGGTQRRSPGPSGCGCGPRTPCRRWWRSVKTPWSASRSEKPKNTSSRRRFAHRGSRTLPYSGWPRRRSPPSWHHARALHRDMAVAGLMVPAGRPPEGVAHRLEILGDARTVEPQPGRSICSRRACTVPVACPRPLAASRSRSLDLGEDVRG